MHFLYALIVELAWYILPIIGLFSPKIKSFVTERKTTFTAIADWKKTQSKKPVLWAHCASLGEYEMIVPILSATELQERFEVVISFFSSSGYIHAKTDGVAKATFYLPFDRNTDMRKLVSEVNPEIFVLAKYDFWLNLMTVLRKHKCKTVLVNGLFHKKQFVGSIIAAPWRNQLKQFSRIFVQNETSYDLLKQWKFDNMELSDDLRYDRVVQLKESNHDIPRIKQFVDNKPTLIMGSSWPDEEHIVLQYLNTTKSSIKVIIAPHDISTQHINKLLQQYKDFKTSLFSDDKDASTSQILILDTIGHLSSAYQYATTAFVGGAYGKGLHNILEAAVYGLVIFTGPNIERFAEASALQSLGALHSIGRDPREFIDTMLEYEQDPSKLESIKQKLTDWFSKHTGQTKRIQQFILSDSD